MEGWVVVVGAGKRERGDDGAGVAVAERVAAAHLPAVRVVDAGDDAVALLDVWADADELYVVDACRCGAEPGTVHRLDGAGASFTPPPARRSSHGLGVLEALELGRCLDRLPPSVWLYGIEVGTCEIGSGLSAPVTAAAERVAAELIAAARTVRREVPHIPGG